MIVTKHAYEQHRARWCPEQSEQGAARLLDRLVSFASPTGEVTPDGGEVWRAGDVRLVVVESEEPVIVTVLPPWMPPEVRRRGSRRRA